MAYPKATCYIKVHYMNGCHTRLYSVFQNLLHKTLINQNSPPIHLAFEASPEYYRLFV